MIPLSVILGDAPGPFSTVGNTQGNSYDYPPSKDDMHYTDRIIRNLVTRILNEGHSVKGVSTPLSRRDPSPEVGPQNERDDDSSRSE